MIFLRQNDFIGQLQVEEIFLEFDGPRLFVASDGAGQKFIVNCLDSDQDGDSWLAVAISDRRLSTLKDGGLELRDVFAYPELTQLKRFRTTTAGTLLESHAVAPVSLTDDELPDAGIFFPPSGEALSPVSAPFLARTLNANVVLLRLFPHTSKHEAPADSVGAILTSFSKYLTHRVERRFRKSMQVANEAMEDFSRFRPQVNVVGTFASSLGVEFAVRGDNELVRQALHDAIRELTQAGNAWVDDGEPADSDDSVPMTTFLTKLSTAGSDLSIEVASRDDEDPLVASLPLEKLKRAVKTLKAARKRRKTSLEVVNALDSGEPHLRNLEVELVGLSLQSRTFEMRSLQTDELIKGTIAADLFNDVSKAELPSHYRVVLQGARPSRGAKLKSMGKLSLVSVTQLF